MSSAAAVAHAARRRIILALGLRHLGAAMLAASLVTLVLVFLDRFAIVRIPWLPAVLVPAAAAALWSLVAIWRARPSLSAAASHVDRALGLHDKLSTTLALDPSSDPFASIAVADGQRAASTAQIDRAVPIVLGNQWWAWPALLATAIACALFVPQLSSGARQQAEARIQVVAHAQGAAQRLEAAVEVARQISADAPEASATELQSLQDLQRELERVADGQSPTDRTPDEAVATAAETLGALAAQEERRAQTERAAADAARESLSRLPAAPTEGSPLERAIRGADIDGARRAASELLRSDKLRDQPARIAAAKELAQLAEDLRHLSESSSSKPVKGDENTPEASTDPASHQPARPSADTQTRELSERLRDAAQQLDPGAVAEQDEATEVSTPDPAADGKVDPPASSATPTPPSTDRNAANRQPNAPPTDEKSAATPESDSRSPQAQPRPAGEKREPDISPRQKQTEPPAQNNEANKPAGNEPSGPRDPANSSQPSPVKPSEQRRDEGGEKPGNSGNDSPSDKAGASPRKVQKPAGQSDASPSLKPGDTESPAGNSKDGKEDPSGKQPGGQPSASKEQSTREVTKRENGAEKTKSAPTTNDPKNGTPPKDGSPNAGDSKPGDSQRRSPPSAQPSTPPDKQSPASSGTSPDKSPTGSPSPSGAVQKPTERSDDTAEAGKRGSTPSDTPDAAPDAKSGEEPQKPQPGGTEADRPRGTPPPPTTPKNAPGESTTPQSSGTEKPSAPPDNLTPKQIESLKRVADQLSKMSDAQRQAGKHDQNAERLREQAQRMYEAASPQQRKRMEQWIAQSPPPSGNDEAARAGKGDGAPDTNLNDRPRPTSPDASPPGTPIRTDPVDARSKSPESSAPSDSEQVVAEWLGEGDRHRDPAAAAAVAKRITEAARSAEQAIGDRTVPSRYDRVLREYFRRLPERVAKPAGPAPVGPPIAPTPARRGEGK